MSSTPIKTRKTVLIGSLARVLSRSESPDPLSIPGVTDFGFSNHDSRANDHQVGPIIDDDTDSNSTSLTPKSSDPASSGDESWSPRSRGQFSTKPSRSPLRRSTKNSVDASNFILTSERQPSRCRDIYDIPSDTDSNSESSKASQQVPVKSLSLGKPKTRGVAKTQRKITKKHNKRYIKKRVQGRVSPAVRHNSHLAEPSEQSFKDSVYDGCFDEAARKLKEQHRIRTERFVQSWMSFNEAATTEMTREKAARRSREVFEGEPMIWL